MVPVHRSNEEWLWPDHRFISTKNQQQKKTRLPVRIILVMCVVRFYDVPKPHYWVFKLSCCSEICREIRQKCIILIFWLSPSLNVRIFSFKIKTSPSSISNKTSTEHIPEHVTLRYPHSVKGNQLLTSKGQFNLRLRKLPNRDSMQNSWIFMVFSSNVYILNYNWGSSTLKMCIKMASPWSPFDVWQWKSPIKNHIMGAMASQVTSITIFYLAVYSGADQRIYQSSAWPAFVWEIHRGPVNSPHKWPVRRKMFPFDDVIMLTKASKADLRWFLCCKPGQGFELAGECLWNETA